MAPQYFTIFSVPPNPGIYSISNVWSHPESRNFCNFQYAEYCDRMDAEPLQWMFLFAPKSFVHPTVSLRMLRAFSVGLSVLKFRTHNPFRPE